MELKICYFGSWGTKFRLSMNFHINMKIFPTWGRVDEKFNSPSHLQSSSRAPCSGKSNKRFVVVTGKSDSVCNTICLCRAGEYMQIVRNWESNCKLSSLPHRLGEASARSSATLKNVYLIENSNINKSLPKKTLYDEKFSVLLCFSSKALEVWRLGTQKLLMSESCNAHVGLRKTFRLRSAMTFPHWQ